MRFVVPLVLSLAIMLPATLGGVYFGGLLAAASTVPNIPSCHASNGSYVRSLVASASAAGPSDIVPGKPGKNYSGANVGIFMHNCTTPKTTVKPVPPPIPADPNAGKYPLELGPVQ